VSTTDTAPPPTRTARQAAGAGALAALAGLVAAEVVALVLPGRPSPVTAVADRIIAGAPDSVRETLIGAVGTLDKPLLVLGIVAVVVGGGALVGRLCASHPTRAPWVLLAAGAVGFVVAWDGMAADLVPLLVVVGVGVTVASLVWNQLVPAPEPDGTAYADGAVERRTVLRAAAVVGGLAVLGVGVVALTRRGSSAAVEAVRSTLRLPVPADPAPALPAGITPAVPGIAPAITPNADFYQIDVSLTAPAVEVSDWSLTVGGQVDSPRTLSYADLLALPSIERHVTLTCVSNEVGGDLVGTARWQGVRLADLLDSVGVQDGADAVVGRSVDGFTAGFPLAVLADGRDAMVAYAMNGEPLPVKHGFPARLVVPGLYGYVSATKWLTEIRLTTLDRDVPFWLSRGWAADGTIEAASRIDVPRTGARVAAGTVAVGGRAWHQHVGVGGVQVSVDDGPWQDAELAAPIGTDTWRLWSFRWEAVSGSHTLRVRMRDLDGTPQDETYRPVFPGAASGLHTISVDVA
jgi:DMSO/TMAO reductase YedYZ molybdopterin-dependent catalytic subunit